MNNWYYNRGSPSCLLTPGLKREVKQFAFRTLWMQQSVRRSRVVSRCASGHPASKESALNRCHRLNR